MINLIRKNNLEERFFEFLKYSLASFIALIVDYTTYLIFLKFNIFSIEKAAVTGYLVGLLVAYFLISKKVFNEGWLKHNPKYEILLFALSGILGITLTYFSVSVYVQYFDENIHNAKIMAVLISFSCVFLFRKFYVFKSGNPRV